MKVKNITLLVVVMENKNLKRLNSNLKRLEELSFKEGILWLEKSLLNELQNNGFPVIRGIYRNNGKNYF